MLQSSINQNYTTLDRSLPNQSGKSPMDSRLLGWFTLIFSCLRFSLLPNHHHPVWSTCCSLLPIFYVICLFSFIMPFHPFGTVPILHWHSQLFLTGCRTLSQLMPLPQYVCSHLEARSHQLIQAAHLTCTFSFPSSKCLRKTPKNSNQNFAEPHQTQSPSLWIDHLWLGSSRWTWGLYN